MVYWIASNRDSQVIYLCAKLYSALLLGLVIGALSLFAAAASPAMAEYLNIRTPDGNCLDVAGNVNANRANVRILECNGTHGQQWEMVQIGDNLGFYEIRSRLGRCVDVSGGINANRTNIQLFDCNQTAAQLWTIPFAAFISTLGRCLDVAGGIDASGTNVQLFDCNQTTAQRWEIVPSVPTGPATTVLIPDPTLAAAAGTTLIGGFRDHDAVLFAGGPSDAAGLGFGCRGFTSRAAAYSVNYVVGIVPNSYPLGFGFISEVDTTLIMRTPDGRWLCNDNVDAGNSNPFIHVPQPMRGQYLLWIGTRENLHAQQIEASGTLLVLEQ